MFLCVFSQDAESGSGYTQPVAGLGLSLYADLGHFGKHFLINIYTTMLKKRLEVLK